MDLHHEVVFDLAFLAEVIFFIIYLKEIASLFSAAPLLEQTVLAPNQQLMQQAALYSQTGTQQSVNFQQASRQQERVNKTGLDIIQDIIRSGLDTIMPSVCFGEDG